LCALHEYWSWYVVRIIHQAVHGGADVASLTQSGERRQTLAPGVVFILFIQCIRCESDAGGMITTFKTYGYIWSMSKISVVIIKAGIMDCRELIKRVR
jgi:hypothetical protein